MPPVYIYRPMPRIYQPRPVVPRPVHHHRPQQLPVQPSNNSQSAGQRIQQGQNQARLQKEIMHGFFESLARLMEQLKDALQG